jgi:hypothetical protein
MPKKRVLDGRVASQDMDGRKVQVSLMGCAYIEFCPHADDRMAQRRISEKDVIEALQAPTRTRLRADVPYERVSLRKHGGTEIHVVFEVRPPKLIVVTVYKQ